MYNIWHQSGILQFVDYTYEFYFPFLLRLKNMILSKLINETINRNLLKLSKPLLKRLCYFKLFRSLSHI